MKQHKDTDKSAPSKTKVATVAIPREIDDIHVPPEAENFEHTLRRLVIEKEKARKGKFGLYR